MILRLIYSETKGGGMDEKKINGIHKGDIHKGRTNDEKDI